MNEDNKHVKNFAILLIITLAVVWYDNVGVKFIYSFLMSSLMIIMYWGSRTKGNEE